MIQDMSCPRCGEGLGVEEDMLYQPLTMRCYHCGAVVRITPRETYDLEDLTPDDAEH